MIRWIDMIDPVYTLARLAGVDPDVEDIFSISVGDHRLMVRYFDKNGNAQFVSKEFSFNE